MAIYNPNLEPTEYFLSLENPMHRQYLALRAFFVECMSAEEVAERYGYTTSTVYSYARNFKEKLNKSVEDPFFKEPQFGRKKLDHGGDISRLVVTYRKSNMSVSDIKATLDAQNIIVSERYISTILTEEGFARLPRRDNKERNQVVVNPAIDICSAPKSERISHMPDRFSTQLAGLLLFLPVIKDFGIDKIIENSDYLLTPGSSDHK